MSGRTSKYRAVKTKYNGRLYDSKLEAGLAAELDLKKRARVIRDWVPQVAVPLMVNGVKVGKLIFDFEVTANDGRKEMWEAKGLETAVYRLKLKMFKAMHPDVVVHVVKKK